MIRPARIEEIDRVIEMIKEDCLEFNYQIDIDYIRDCVSEMITQQCLVFVSEKYGKLVGLTIMIISPNMFNPKESDIKNILWYASKDLTGFGRARVMVELLDFMVWLAKDRGINLHVSLPNTIKLDNGCKLLESRGLNMSEKYYKLAV